MSQPQQQPALIPGGTMTQAQLMSALLLMRDIDRDDRAANAIIYIESLENQVMDLTMKLRAMTQPVTPDESPNLQTK